MMRGWGLLLVSSLFWLQSHALPWVHESDPGANSVWTIYSDTGRVGWSWVELDGPSPERTFGTSAAESVRALRDEDSSWWNFGFRFTSEHRTEDPDRELDAIHRREVGVGWGLLVLVIAITRCWTWCREQWNATARSRPTD